MCGRAGAVLGNSDASLSGQADRLQMCLQLGEPAPPGKLTWGLGHTWFLSSSLCVVTVHSSAAALTHQPLLPAVYVVEERRRDDTGESACLTACWTALCCCCLWDMLT